MYSLYSAFLIILFSRRLRCLEIAIKRKKNIVGEILAILLLVLFTIYLLTLSKSMKQ